MPSQFTHTCNICSGQYTSRRQSKYCPSCRPEAARRRTKAWKKKNTNNYTPKQVHQKLCATCQTVFVAELSWHKYCSKLCKDAANRQSASRKAWIQRRQDEKRRQANKTFECIACHASFSAIHYREEPLKYCSPTCRQEYRKGTKKESASRRNYRAKVRAKKYGCYICPKLTTDVLHKLLTSVEACNICGTDLVWASTTEDQNAKSLDHIIPLSKGGPHQLDNIQIVCHGCNIKKAAYS